MKVLVGCEFSGVVRDAFIAAGHDAMSCDLEPADGPHYRGDVRDLFTPGQFDLFIAHPPCTHLSVSGARHFASKRADGRQQEAISFFMDMVRAPFDRVAVENPVCIMSSVWRKPDQIIQPHNFGHPEFKATCLWLKGLPLLGPTNQLAIPAKGTDEHKAWQRVHRMSPGPDRAALRSITYAGIARAMASQWAIAERLAA